MAENTGGFNLAHAQAISSAASAAGAVSAAGASKRNLQRTIDAQKAAADLAYSRDVEQWNLANEYNSPSAQMQRMKDAGLNPAMMYGSSGGTTPAATLPKYSVTRPDYSQQKSMGGAVGLGLGGMLSQYNDLRMQSAQRDLVQEQANTQRIGQAIQIAKLPGIRGQSKITSELARYASGMAWQQNRMLIAQSGAAMIKRKIAGEHYEQSRTQTAFKREALQLKKFEVDLYRQLQGIKGASQIFQIIKSISGR